jgi:hypothetical protein
MPWFREARFEAKAARREAKKAREESPDVLHVPGGGTAFGGVDSFAAARDR